ncbi:MAG: signal peptidase I [Treponema sp.]|jgi:signal peptidase I|nr:signal peptidase I [Treponema sp.]
MKKKRSSYSYKEEKKYQRQWRVVLICGAVFFTVYVCFTSFLFSMRVSLSDSMQPGIHVKDRFVFSSYELYTPELQRGGIVLVDMGDQEKRDVFMGFLDGFIRFWTFQRAGIREKQEFLYLKRVIALPGDEVSMTNFVARVKKKDSPYWITEFESSERHYEVIIPQAPALWDRSLPFSGTLDSFVLGEDECFLLSDDRSNTNDSRTWGPAPLKRVKGAALFRYWPITRIGKP